VVLVDIDPALLVYVAAFALAALVCLVSVARARRVDDPETRRGLVWLLLLSAGWAGSHVGFLLAPTAPLRMGFYLAGLVVGLATVGPWLYFCSAYTGRTFHRDRTYRRLAVGFFVVVSALKLTNPLHGRYVSATAMATPFPHLAVRPEPLHWLVAGLVYVVTAAGAFMLLERFRKAGADTTPLVVLVGLTALPVGLDLVGYATPYLVEVTYEPLGVAAFAVGTLFLYTERFRAVRVAGDNPDPVVVLGEDDRIRDYNDAAMARFPALAGSVGDPVGAALPALGDHLDADATASAAPTTDGAGARPAREVLEHATGGEPAYYLVTVARMGSGGRRVVLRDVSHSERQRRELARQNERLDRFAGAVGHDLRNPLNAASAQLDVARHRSDGETPHLDTVAEEHERMSEMIADLLTLAREGRTIGETEPVALADLAADCWNRIDPEGTADLRVETDRRVSAAPDRLRQALENLFRNALEHAGADGPPTVTVGDCPDGFYVADDGPGIPPDRRAAVFETGHTTAADGTGFGLAIVREVVTAHGWDVRVTESATGGARFEVTGVTTPD
jgi:signal transduction histidine kinase